MFLGTKAFIKPALLAAVTLAALTACGEDPKGKDSSLSTISVGRLETKTPWQVMELSMKGKDTAGKDFSKIIELKPEDFKQQSVYSTMEISVPYGKYDVLLSYYAIAKETRDNKQHEAKKLLYKSCDNEANTKFEINEPTENLVIKICATDGTEVGETPSMSSTSITPVLETSTNPNPTPTPTPTPTPVPPKYDFVFAKMAMCPNANNSSFNDLNFTGDDKVIKKYLCSFIVGDLDKLPTAQGKYLKAVWNIKTQGKKYTLDIDDPAGVFNFELSSQSGYTQNDLPIALEIGKAECKAKKAMPITQTVNMTVEVYPAGYFKIESFTLASLEVVDCP